MTKSTTAADMKAMEARGREVMAANTWSEEARQASAEARRNKAKIGDRVRVSQGSGIDSGKEGVVAHPSEVKTDGRGIPTNISGA